MAKCSFISIIKLGSWTMLRNKVFEKDTMFFNILIRRHYKTYFKILFFTWQSDPLIKITWFSWLHFFHSFVFLASVALMYFSDNCSFIKEMFVSGIILVVGSMLVSKTSGLPLSHNKCLLNPCYVWGTLFNPYRYTL